MGVAGKLYKKIAGVALITGFFLFSSVASGSVGNFLYSFFSPVSTDRYIEIDLSAQNLKIFENGQEKGSFIVSTGRNGMETPTGTFYVMSKISMLWSEEYHIYMPWFLQFTSQGHGIHELPEWPGGYKEGASHLGSRVSHGCVRLGVGPAKQVYDFASVGMPIYIHQ